ncbi:MAG: penicillin-binding protein activator LpoB [Treponema sp.]|nr:penicillin-binding protein activator LpoB [Treponema sp.]
MKSHYFFPAVGLIIVMAFSACSSTPTVTRIDSGTQIDLSGYWNDTDVRIVCEYLINDCLNSPRVDQAIRAMGGRTPVVLVGRFRNESDEHIDTAIITSIMERTIFNSGKMDFVAGGAARDELRAERQDQLSGYTSDETAASLGREVGADFLLTGTVRTIVDRIDNQSVRTYFVNAEMTSIETNERIWMGQHSDIKKIIARPRNRL